MEPTNFRDCRCNTVTLWCWRPQITPRHRQKWMLSFQECITLKGSTMILPLNSSNANRSVSLFPPATEVTNKPHHKRRIKAFMQKEEDGRAELNWESPICNMVEEAVRTSACLQVISFSLSKQNRGVWFRCLWRSRKSTFIRRWR